MKKIPKILGGIVVVVAVIVGIAFTLTADLPKSADAFFALVKDGKTEDAYQSTAKAFQDATSMDQFTTFLEQTGLNQYASASYNSRSFENDQGRLEGTVTLSDGTSKPIQVDLTKENGTWKVLGVNTKY